MDKRMLARLIDRAGARAWEDAFRLLVLLGSRTGRLD